MARIISKKFAKETFVNGSEKKAALFLEKHLPDEWKIYTNKRIPDPKNEEKNPLEIDLIILGKNGVHILETKNLYGRVTDDGDRWTFENGEGTQNPLNQVCKQRTILENNIRQNTVLATIKNLGELVDGFVLIPNHRNEVEILSHDNRTKTRLLFIDDVHRRLEEIDKEKYYNNKIFQKAKKDIQKFLDKMEEKDPIPKVLNRFRIDKRIESTLYREVYEAHHRDFPEKEGVLVRITAEKFPEEHEVLKRLDSTGVLPEFSLPEDADDGGCVIYFFRKPPGYFIDEILKKEPILSAFRALGIAFVITKALNKIYEKKLTGIDLSPSKIIFTEEENPKAYFIGLKDAKIENESGNSSLKKNLSKTGELLYLMLTGKNLLEIKHKSFINGIDKEKILNSLESSLSDRDKKFSDEIYDVIIKLICRENEPYQDIQEVIKALEDLKVKISAPLTKEEKQEAEFRKNVVNLKSDVSMFRDSAAKQLYKLNDLKTIAPFTDVLFYSDDEVVKKYAEKTILKFGKESVEPLLETLRSGRKVNYTEAIRLLGELKDPSIIEPLIQICREMKFSWYEVFPMKAIVDTLVNIGEASVLPLIKTLKDDDERIVYISAATLGKIGDVRAVEPLMESLNLNSRWPYGRLRALMEIGDPASYDCFLKEFQNSSFLYRELAATALGELGDPRAIEPLLEVLNEDFNEKFHDVKKNYAAEIDDTMDEDMADDIIFNFMYGDLDRFDNQDDEINDIEDLDDLIYLYFKEIKHSIVRALGHFNDSRVFITLFELLDSEETYLYKESLDSIFKIGTREKNKNLFRHETHYNRICELIKSADPEIRDRAIKVVSHYNNVLDGNNDKYILDGENKIYINFAEKVRKVIISAMFSDGFENSDFYEHVIINEFTPEDLIEIFEETDDLTIRTLIADFIIKFMNKIYVEEIKHQELEKLKNQYNILKSFILRLRGRAFTKIKYELEKSLLDFSIKIKTAEGRLNN
ncbi:MAG: NERD domain-containing protein [Chloroflexi bacterium]|nr:NERD domain-containing protein [Chloroflexota bacterium]